MTYGAYAFDDKGYDFSLFETTRGTAVPKETPKKKRVHRNRNNIIELPEIQIDKSQRKKHNVASLVIGGIITAILVFAVSTVIVGQARLTELNEQVAEAERTLAHSQSIGTQTQAKVEAVLSAASVEEYAVNNLNMVKANSRQKEYISLSQGDKAEIYMEEEKTVFDEIAAFFSSLWS